MMKTNYKDFEIEYSIWSFNCEKFFFIATWETKPVAKGITLNERVFYEIDNLNREKEIERCLKQTKKEVDKREKARVKRCAKIVST